MPRQRPRPLAGLSLSLSLRVKSRSVRRCARRHSGGGLEPLCDARDLLDDPSEVELAGEELAPVRLGLGDDLVDGGGVPLEDALLGRLARLVLLGALGRRLLGLLGRRLRARTRSHKGSQRASVQNRVEWESVHGRCVALSADGVVACVRAIC